MEKVSINITIEEGVIEITDNFGNKSCNDFDPDVLISDQIGTYVVEHIETYKLYDDIIAEGYDNADLNDDENDDGYCIIDEEDFDELDD